MAQAAAAAMADLAASNPNLKLRHDPTKELRIPFQVSLFPTEKQSKGTAECAAGALSAWAIFIHQ